MVIINQRDKIEWEAGMTVTDIFKIMKYDYALITVLVNGKYIPEEDYGSTLIQDEDDVRAYHLAHGG